MGENFSESLKGESELKISVKGRKTGKVRSAIVSFVHEGVKIYLLPVKGSETGWYRNVLKNPSITLTVGGRSLQSIANPITKPDGVKKVIGLFAAKYGGMNEINKWYSKLDVAVEVSSA